MLAAWYGSVMARELEDLATTEDAGRDRPARGPAWGAAIEAGIDVTLLEHRVRLPPFLRLREHTQHACFTAAVQGRVVPQAVAAALARRRLEESVAAFGMKLEQVLEPTHGDGR